MGHQGTSRPCAHAPTYVSTANISTEMYSFVKLDAWHCTPCLDSAHGITKGSCLARSSRPQVKLYNIACPCRHATTGKAHRQRHLYFT